MNTILENWFIIMAGLAVLILLVELIRQFVLTPREKQLSQLRQWLLYAVIQTEKELGKGSGQLKLRAVYDLFLQRFPTLAKIMSFDAFSALVDEALEEMKELLDNNQNIKAIVEGDSVC